MIRRCIFFVYVTFFITNICLTQSQKNTTLFKFSNIAVSNDKDIVKVEGDTFPLNPTGEDRVFGFSAELLFAKYKSNLSFIYSLGYSQVSVTSNDITFRDTIQFASSSLLKSKDFMLSFGLVKKVNLKDSPLSGLVSARIFGRNRFVRTNHFNTRAFSFENNFLGKATRDIVSPTEIDVGILLNLNILYSIGNKFSFGLGITNAYFMRNVNGVTNNQTIVLNDQMETVRDTLVITEQKRTAIFDTTNFALIFSYSFN